MTRKGTGWRQFNVADAKGRLSDSPARRRGQNLALQCARFAGAPQRQQHPPQAQRRPHPRAGAPALPGLRGFLNAEHVSFGHHHALRFRYNDRRDDLLARRTIRSVARAGWSWPGLPLCALDTACRCTAAGADPRAAQPAQLCRPLRHPPVPRRAAGDQLLPLWRAWHAARGHSLHDPVAHRSHAARPLRNAEPADPRDDAGCCPCCRCGCQLPPPPALAGPGAPDPSPTPCRRLNRPPLCCPATMA